MKILDPLAARPPSPAVMIALLATLAALGLPHLAHVGPWPTALFLGALAWRLAAVFRCGLLPPRWPLLALTLGGLLLVVWTLPVRSGHVAGSALLLVMLGLKQLESHTRRDLYLSLLLGHFVILTQFLFEQSLGFALYLFALSLVLVALQTALNRRRAGVRELAASTGRIVAAAVPLAVLLFLFFPRLDAPLWRIELDHAGARTGISGEMRLGEIGHLARSDAVAFRVRFQGEAPDNKTLYWRGPVLWRFDGNTWRRLDPPGPPPSPRVDPQSRIHYELTLEPSGRRWIFPLDVPASLPRGIHLDADLQAQLDTPLEKRRTFHLASWTRYRLPELSSWQRRAGLQLPERIGPRTRALAQEWRTRHPQDDAAVAREALRHFNQRPFVYTLAPGASRGDPIEHFLFESRRGFCEHYAGSFALLMRLTGIPARIVTGYQGGSRNPLADHWVVRQSDAHAWVEIWLPDNGWVRIDPTAAVAPQRIERGIDGAASAASDGRVVFLGGGTGWWSGLLNEGRWLIDAIDLGWYRWVLGFDTGRQQSLLAWLGLDRAGHYAAALAASIGMVLFGGLFWVMARRPRHDTGDPLRKIWRRFLDRLRRGGLALPEWSGPLEVARQACRHWPESAPQIERFVRAYISLRYGQARPSARHRRLLRRHLRSLRLPVRSAAGR